MKKGEVIKIGKMLSREYFRMFLEDNKKEIDFSDDDIIIMGLKDFEDLDEYIIILSLKELQGYYCEMTFVMSTGRLKHTYIYKRIDL